MSLQVYSTLTRKKEPFPKQPGETVTMYVCGPTVYKPSHIGHMVGPVIFDTVKRYLVYLGFKVKWVVNITDVDDKLIIRAKELSTTVPALAGKMTADYFECLKLLNVVGIDEFPRATDHIRGMVRMISQLIEKGFAYTAGGSVYFDVSKSRDYGKLSNFDPEQLEAGSRIEVSDQKKNPGDFALWKGDKPGEPIEVQFESPWGKGRPGWHIECSAMASQLLGETIDIHGGGLDLQFPHHENELAQSEAASGKPFARVWMHNGLIKMKSGKMAGSIGNVMNVVEALKHVSGNALRFFILGTHYRSPIDLGEWDPKSGGIPPGLMSARAGFDTFLRFAERVHRITQKNLVELSDPVPIGSDSSAARAMRSFEEYMNDDFNTGGAIGVLFESVSHLNKLADSHKLESPGANQLEALREFQEGAVVVKQMMGILGLTLDAPKVALGGDDKLVAGLMQLLIDLRGTIRTEAKGAAKDNPLKPILFAQTDLIRARLAELGVTLEDRAGGTTWRVN